MNNRRIWCGLSLAILMILVVGIGGMTFSALAAMSEEGVGPLASGPGASAAQLPPGPALPSSQATLSGGDSGDLGARAPSVTAPGDVLEVFTNTWSYSTIGLVYDPGRASVRYAHESQSSAHNSTVYEVDYAVPHPVLSSFALSTINSGWPWQIDNRTGAGYDFVQDTYFLPDYNGDLSYADDNIVEIDANGTILNAWEMDAEVGSNDSSDGSAIDNIIDIAVVPGTPPRYFVTAAYDGAVVYEIALIKTGTWWTPNSWHTVATYTLPLLGDNLGIDWDAEHEVLFHSSWDTTTILITNLGMNPITEVAATFDCPGAGGYNSGVTYVEGSDPTEVWVTDFSSDQTTRCETPFLKEALPPGWDKWVDGQPWFDGLVLPKQTGQMFEVTDVITSVEALTLTESWNPDHLELVNVEVLPPVGTAITGTGSLEIRVPAGPPERVTVLKLFRVLPCNWTDTVLEEYLVVEGGPPFVPRLVHIEKQLPVLEIDSAYEPEVLAGSVASFTLSYANTGGFENDVWISNTFPMTVPFVYAQPFPDAVGPGGSWARWDIGDLAQGQEGNIDVYVLIDETVPTSRTITIWDGIFDHMDVLRDETFIEFHANQQAFTVDWQKFINDQPWQPDMSVTLQTSDTLLIEEFIGASADGFSLIERWNPDELELLPGAIIDPPIPPIVSEPGFWVLEVPPSPDPVPVTIIKEFHVRPSNWPETILWETLQVGTAVRHRPVRVEKVQPELWIDSFFDVTVYSGDEAEFELIYGNTGGFENQAWIRNEFPPEAPFLDSAPSPDEVGPGGSWVIWDVGALPNGAEGTIDVSVRIAPGLPPSTTIEIWDGIFDHADVLEDETVIAYHVPPPTWEKWVNELPWNPDLVVGVQTSDTLRVTDVISTRSAVAIVEHWNPELLRLDEYALDPPLGEILPDPGSLVWRFPMGAPGTITITKIFHVEPGAWTYTVLWEELWVEHVEWERWPVHIDKMPPVYLPLVLRGYSE